MKNHDHKIDHLRAENDMIDHKLKHNLPLYHESENIDFAEKSFS